MTTSPGAVGIIQGIEDEEIFDAQLNLIGRYRAAFTEPPTQQSHCRSTPGPNVAVADFT